MNFEPRLDLRTMNLAICVRAANSGFELNGRVRHHVRRLRRSATRPRGEDVEMSARVVEMSAREMAQEKWLGTSTKQCRQKV